MIKEKDKKIDKWVKEQKKKFRNFYLSNDKVEELNLKKEFKSLSEKMINSTGEWFWKTDVKDAVELFLLEFGTATLYNKDEIKSILKKIFGKDLI